VRAALLGPDEHRVRMPKPPESHERSVSPTPDMPSVDSMGRLAGHVGPDDVDEWLAWIAPHRDRAMAARVERVKAAISTKEKAA